MVHNSKISASQATAASSTKKAKTSLYNATQKVLRPFRSTTKQHRATEQDRLHIKLLHEQGKNNAEISRTVGIHRSNVSRMIKKNVPLKRIYTQRKRPVLTPRVLSIIKRVQKEHATKNRGLTNKIWVNKCARLGWKGANVRTLRDAKKELGFETRIAQIKARVQLSTDNKSLRLQAAKTRKGFTLAQLMRIIWIDESEGQITACRYHVLEKGAARPMVTVPDPKSEKVHFLVAVGNGEKDFRHLPVRRPAMKDKKGNTIHRTAATGRRKKGKTEAAKKVNQMLNKPNEGMTWSGATLTPIFKEWVQTNWFKNCFGVVLDNAKPHFAIRKLLEQHKIKLIYQPPNSPDMNVVERVHQAIKQQAQNYYATNNVELLAAFKKGFEKFRVNDFNNKYLPSYRDNVLSWIIDNEGETSPF